MLGIGISQKKKKNMAELGWSREDGMDENDYDSDFEFDENANDDVKSYWFMHRKSEELTSSMSDKRFKTTFRMSYR